MLNSLQQKKLIELSYKKREAIKEIQQYFLALSRAGVEVPRLKIDGVYGDETREAVRIFQALMGIPVTGIVDIITWNLLYSEYTAALYQNGRAEGIFPFEEGLTQGVLSPDESSNIVYILQILLETVSLYYDEMVQQSITGIFDEVTEENLKAFQRQNNIPETGVLDKLTWNVLARAYGEYINRE